MAKNIIGSGRFVKIKIDQVYLDLAISVNKSKVLPEKDTDLQNSLDFLTEIVKK